MTDPKLLNSLFCSFFFQTNHPFKIFKSTNDAVKKLIMHHSFLLRVFLLLLNLEVLKKQPW